jgi:hypothetical protein
MAEMSNNLRSRIGHIVAIAAFTFLAAGTITAIPAFAASGEACPNEAVRAESNVNPTTGQPYSLGLPECRAYEMVSPLDKQQHDAIELSGVQAPTVSPDGGAIGWQSQGDFAGAESYQAGERAPVNPYISQRTVSGWITRSGWPPSSLIEAPVNTDSALLPRNVLLTADLSTEADCGLATLRAGDFGSGLVCAARKSDGSWLSTPSVDSLYGELSGRPYVEGASADLTSVVIQPGFALPAHFLPSDTSPLEGCPGCQGLYEMSGVGGASPRLRQVDIDNNGNMIGPENAVHVGAIRGSGSTYQAMSQDGANIFFTATPNASNGFGASTNVQTIFARVAGTSTVDISNPSPSECTRCTQEAEEGKPENSEAKPATFWGASADGSKVFFTTTQQLVNGDTDSTSDLYEYDFNNPPAHRIIQISGGGLGDLTPGTGAAMHGVVSISEDGSHVYFIAPGVLTTLPNALGQTASVGEKNLYGYDTESGETKFVATLSSRDSVEMGQGGNQGAQATPDGQYLIFDTYARLIGNDTNTGQAVYRYDFSAGELTWMSHAATNFSSTDEGLNATVATKPTTEAGGALPSTNDANRAITDDGSYVVFSTSERLQASDVNGAPNVYLWHDGVVSMISDGHDPAGALYPVISASGADVFFETREQLVGQDTDTLADIYDARIGGGFPAPTPEPSCSGEACQGTPSGPHSLGSSGTSSFTGGGNLTPGSTAFPPPEGPKATPLTRAQKLTKALKSCKKDKSKFKRKSCEKTAHKKYSPKPKPKAKK